MSERCACEWDYTTGKQLKECVTHKELRARAGQVEAENKLLREMLNEAAERLFIDNARLRKALKPFAEAAVKADDGSEQDDDPAWKTAIATLVKYGDFRRARAALEGEDK